MAVRTTRARIIHLRNDHKDVMKYLEKGLHAHFAQLQAQAVTATANGTTVSSVPSTSAADNGISDATAHGTPFARVNSVEPRSPAEQAGLKTGDLIRGFGAVHWLNHERLSKVAETVQQHEGVRCCARVLSLLLLRKSLTVYIAPSYRQDKQEKRQCNGNHRSGFAAYATAQLGWSGTLGVSSRPSVVTSN